MTEPDPPATDYDEILDMLRDMPDDLVEGLADALDELLTDGNDGRIQNTKINSSVDRMERRK